MTRKYVRVRMIIPEGVMYMKEMLHSKVLIGFILFVLGFTYMNSNQMNYLEQDENSTNEIVYIS